MRLSSLTNRTKSLSVPIGGDTLNLSYRPGAFTTRFEREIRESRDTSALGRMVLGLVTEWDLIGEDGNPYPLTEEALSDLPLDFLAAVANAIGDDAVPNPPSASGS